jgi:uncharacterized protein with von Willebrand factor type A (vWA) domain
MTAAPTRDGVRRKRMAKERRAQRAYAEVQPRQALLARRAAAIYAQTWDVISGRETFADDPLAAAILAQMEFHLSVKCTMNEALAALVTEMVTTAATSYLAQHNDHWEEAASAGWRMFYEWRAEQHQRGCCSTAASFNLVDPKAQPAREQMKPIADLAGAMREVLKGRVRARTPDIPEEIVGIHQGGDVPRLTADELALWALGGAPRAELQARIMDRRAEQYDVAGFERRGRGALVIVIDESGSMGGGTWSRNVWAKACMTALTEIAWDDRRPVKLVHYSTLAMERELRRGDQQALRDAQACFLDGGTATLSALRVAADAIGAWEHVGVHNADIVCITDGDSDDLYGHPFADFMAELKLRSIRLYSVGVGAYMSEGHPLRRHAERYTYVSDGDLSQASGAQAVVDAIATGEPSS